MLYGDYIRVIMFQYSILRTKQDSYIFYESCSCHVPMSWALSCSEGSKIQEVCTV